MSLRDNEKVLLTISRQMGSGGSYVGRRLAKRLGFKYVDRDILRRATEYLHEDQGDLAFREERVSGFFEDLLRSFMYGSPGAAYVPPPIRPIYDIELFKAEAIKIIADKHNAVIVGRAGFHVLKGRRGLVNVFLHASEEFRVRHSMEVHHITDPAEAITHLRESDTNRRRFINAVVGVEWTESPCYHLCIDTAFSGFATAEEIILKLVEKVRTG